MKRALLVLALGCGAKQSPVVAVAGVDAGVAPTNVPPIEVAPSRPCAIDVGSVQTFAIPARLTAIAPQYFHPGGHEGFNDLIPGTSRYRWYDPSDLQAPIEPPGDMNIIVRTTKSFLIGQLDGQLRVARRGGHEAKRIGRGSSMRILDATEDRLGNAWVIATDGPAQPGSDLFVMRVSPDLSWDQTPEPLFVGANLYDAAIGVTDDRNVGVVLLERDAGDLRIDVWWTAPKRPWSVPHPVDQVTIPLMAVELSVRTTVDLSVAAHSTDSLAIAWRPLAPKDGEHVDAGSKGRPPTKPASATVRIVLARAGQGAIAPAIVHPTVAAPLGGTSGIGPWPLHASGMRGGTLHQQAVFAWNDDGVIKLASPGEATARTLDTGFPRLIFRSAGSDLDLLMLQSSGPQKMIRLGCAR